MIAHLPTPRDTVSLLEAAPRLPADEWERFAGYGVLGIAFASGQILTLRRILASSLGPAVTTVWHRDAARRWTFYVDAEPELTCARYFGAAGRIVREDGIGVSWHGPTSFSVRVRGAGLAWAVHLSRTRASRALAALRRGLPAPIRRRRGVQSTMASAAARAAGVREFRSAGRTPSGHRFRLDPYEIWTVDASTARRHGQHFGPPIQPRSEVRLGDFSIPGRGVFTIGDAFFEPDRTMP